MLRTDDETMSITTVINKFSKTWTLLLQYDENSLARPKTLHPTHKVIDYQKATKTIAILKTELSKRDEAGDLFGRERDHQLQGILGNISQTFDSNELYPSAEETVPRNRGDEPPSPL